MRYNKGRVAGFTVLEVAVAGVVFSVAIVGIYGVYSESARLMLAADHGAIGSVHLLQRMDQLRRSSWTDATSSASVSALLATPIAATTANLPTVVEEHITLSGAALPQASPVPSPQPAPTATPVPFTVTRRGTTVTVTPASPASLVAQPAVNVLVSLTWLDNANQSHTREFSAVLSRAALTR